MSVLEKVVNVQQLPQEKVERASPQMPLNPNYIVYGVHGHAPGRVTYHAGEVFERANKKTTVPDYTAADYQTCFEPNIRVGSVFQMSGDFTPAYLHEIERYARKVEASDTKQASEVRGNLEKLREGFFRQGKRGIATTEFHTILPLENRVAQAVNIQAGLAHYKAITGEDARVFWPSEGAVNTGTLVELSNNNIEVVVVDQRTSGSDKPVRVNLPNGKSIILEPYQRSISDSIAFDTNLRRDAEQVVRERVVPELRRKRAAGDNTVTVTMLDFQANGNYDPQKRDSEGRVVDPKAPGSEYFAEWYLNEALPHPKDEHGNPISDGGATVISFNDLAEYYQQNPELVQTGTVQPNTAWSSDQKLNRWLGKGQYRTDGGVAWKQPYNVAVTTLHTEVECSVREGLGEQGKDHDQSFISRMVKGIERGYTNPGPPDSTPEQSYEAAWANSLAASESGSLFYSSPNPSGHPQIVSAFAACTHLAEAGKPEEAKAIWQEFRANMAKMPDPDTTGKTGNDLINFLLGETPLDEKEPDTF